MNKSMITMQERLKQVILYKANGVNAAFAREMGWKPQYVANLLSGASMGIQPLLTILEHYPDINARWLLLGEGTMLDVDIVQRTQQLLIKLQSLEPYIKYMTKEELIKYNNGYVDFTRERIEQWELQNKDIS